MQGVWCSVYCVVGCVPVGVERSLSAKKRGRTLRAPCRGRQMRAPRTSTSVGARRVQHRVVTPHASWQQVPQSALVSRKNFFALKVLQTHCTVWILMYCQYTVYYTSSSTPVVLVEHGCTIKVPPYQTVVMSSRTTQYSYYE